CGVLTELGQDLVDRRLYLAVALVAPGALDQVPGALRLLADFGLDLVDDRADVRRQVGVGGHRGRWYASTARTGSERSGANSRPIAVSYRPEPFGPKPSAGSDTYSTSPRRQKICWVPLPWW